MDLQFHMMERRLGFYTDRNQRLLKNENNTILTRCQKGRIMHSADTVSICFCDWK